MGHSHWNRETIVLLQWELMKTDCQTDSLNASRDCKAGSWGDELLDSVSNILIKTRLSSTNLNIMIGMFILRD